MKPTLWNHICAALHGRYRQDRSRARWRRLKEQTGWNKGLSGPMKITLALLFALALSTVAFAADVRLATAKTAFVVAADDLEDDKPVAACLAERLNTTTPLTAVSSKDGADVILTVSKAKISGDSMRNLFGALGSVRLAATAPDGTKLWDGFQSLSMTTNQDVLKYSQADIACKLADVITEKLRDAMKKARGKTK